MKNRYFMFFIPSSPIQYFAVRAHDEKDVRYLIGACSNDTDETKEKKIEYVGELTQSGMEKFRNRCIVL